jgi:hypothetical protein
MKLREHLKYLKIFFHYEIKSLLSSKLAVIPEFKIASEKIKHKMLAFFWAFV